MSSRCQCLVQGEALGNVRLVKVRCVRRDVHEYPLVPVINTIQVQKRIVEVAVSPCITNPLILGTTWPGFKTSAKEMFVHGP